MISLGRGTLVAAVLTDEGLLVAADSRYSLVQPRAASERRRKIRLVPRPPRTVLCVAGVDRIVHVPGVTRAGWEPGPADVLLDVGEIAASFLPEDAADLTERWLDVIASECTLRMNRDPRIAGQAQAAVPGVPFSQIVVASAEADGRCARLGHVSLYRDTVKARMAAAPAEISELSRAGEHAFFGDLPFLLRELPAEYESCRAAVGVSPLPAAAALSAVASLVEAAGPVRGSVIGGPTDAVLVASDVTKLRW